VIRRPRSPDHTDVSNPALALRALVKSTGRPELVELVREHFQFVWRLLRRLGLPGSDADDAAQQVFLVACSRAADIRPGSERPFLYGCALRSAAKWRARASASPRLDLSSLDEPASDWPGADELLEHRRARAVLDALLESMDHDLRVVFVLFEFEELSTQEIAELLAIPRGTVASRLRRAREDFEQRVLRYERRRDFRRPDDE
jgi:RNA polymerase sigma-70 factor (ECF subfamily)